MTKPMFTPSEAVDAILDGEKDEAGVQACKWGPADYGTGATVTYSYRAQADIELAEKRELTLAEIQMFEGYIQLLEDVANIDLVRVDERSDRGDIRIEALVTGGGGSAGWQLESRSPTNLITTGGFTTDSNVTRHVSLHELGHVIGLYHPGPYNYGGFNYEDHATHYQDTYQYTIMSYWSATHSGASYGYAPDTTFMVHDVMALQRLYGANTEAFGSNTIYGFNSNTDRDPWTVSSANESMYGAIWDTGGIDTIDTSGYNQRSIIDLDEYSFSSLNGETYNLSIAPDVIIENAIGGSAPDVIYGNAHENLLIGNDGYDHLYGESGRDRIFGGFKNNYDGNAETLTGNYLHGGDGNDVLYGVDNRDRIHGGNHDDFLTGNGGDDYLHGGDGFDFAMYNYATSRVVVDLTANTATGGDGRDELQLIEGVHGSAFDDRLIGDAQRNVLIGDDGNDYLLGNAGDDTLAGGFGSDVVSYANATSSVYVHLAAGTATGGDGTDRLTSIEHVFGSDHADRISGTSGTNTILGYAGNDVLFASSNLDYAGDDDRAANLLRGMEGEDWLFGGDGDDELSGGTEDDELIGNAGDDHLDGGEGNDRADYGYATAGVVVDLAAGTATGGDGADTLVAIENVAGSAFDDRLVGDAANNWLEGNAGHDQLVGGGGVDVLHAGFDADGSALYAGAADDYDGDGERSANRLTGSDGSDYVSGGDGNDTIHGRDGNDYILGNGGDDTIYGGDGVDTIYHSHATAGVSVNLTTGLTSGGDGNDTLHDIEWADGSSHDDSLIGSSAANRLRGYDGNDTLMGMRGADTLWGNTGDDRLFGGSRDGASDTFAFGVGHGTDIIFDFENGIDRILYDDMRAPTAPSSFADLTVTTSGDDAIVSVTADASFGSIQVVNMASHLDAGDFLFS